MKKMAIGVLLGVLLTATAAQAEHKLLITDVLDAKQLEAEARFEYTHLSGDFGLEANATDSLYSLGVGLGHGLEVTAAIPYLFNEEQKSRYFYDESRHGIGDFAVQAKYRLLGGEEEPYTVVTGLGVKFDTGGEGGTGTTDISPFIAASTNLGHHYIPYAIYRATIRTDDAPDTHTLSLGLEKELNHTVTLDGKIDANFNTGSSSNDFTFELTSYIQVAHNFYLLPTAAYLVATDHGINGYRVGGSLYYLF